MQLRKSCLRYTVFISAFRKAILHYSPVQEVLVVKRPQKKIKCIRSMEFHKSSIKHLSRRDYHMQHEQYLSKNGTWGWNQLQQQTLRLLHFEPEHFIMQEINLSVQNAPKRWKITLITLSYPCLFHIFREVIGNRL